MDKRAASLYLTKLFGTRKGYVAAAYKDGKNPEDWQESQFSWPEDKDKLIGWAEIHQDANIFICPALRKDAHTRKKGGMAPGRWLWADVDWQGVPAEKRAEVEARIKELGSLVIRSGSGQNVHVYVQLTTDVDATQHAKLNTGLRDYLYADNKQADNSLLRLPGTTNWKTDAGSAVKVVPSQGRAVSPASLLKRRVFRDAKVIADVEASDWTFVNIRSPNGRLGRRLKMLPDEAIGRYGSRHDAVFATVSDLHRQGFDNDQVHSLMHQFPPGLHKMAEENGYDLHLDIDRCLARINVVDQVAPDLSPEDRAAIAQELDDDSPFSEITPEEDEEDWKRRVGEKADEIRLRNEAAKLARQREAERTWVVPPPDVSCSLTDALKHPPRPIPHLINGLAGKNHNVVITAQYKTGKTAFTLGSLAQSLCDGTDFLDRYPVNVPEGGAIVGHWNCEMDPTEILDDYVRPVGIDHTNNLVWANLRGYRVDILSDHGKKWAVDWLKSRNVQVWTIDSFARLARMAGVSEKDNDEVMSLLMALDEIKVEAGVEALFLITHTGRAEQEEGKERARGATAIDDWADARWIMTKMDQTRFLRVEGRGVALEDTPLIFDKDTGRSVAGHGGKADVKEDGGVQAVVRVIKEQPGMTQVELFKVMKSSGVSQRLCNHYVEEAVEAGFIEVKPDPSRNGRPAKRHYLAGYEKPEDDRTRRATPGDVDLRGVRTRRSVRGADVKSSGKLAT